MTPEEKAKIILARSVYHTMYKYPRFSAYNAKLLAIDNATEMMKEIGKLQDYLPEDIFKEAGLFWSDVRDELKKL
jgi:hypothetical protein